jgi:nitroreductase
MTTSNSRTAEQSIDPQFLDRWSPRAFRPDPIPEATLLTLLEAARWAPSSYNSQPWRFVYAKRDTSYWEQFVGFLNGFNQSWAKHAAAIVVVLSKRTFTPPGGAAEIATPTHSFDTGAAWAYLALQASLSGWHAHGLAGIERERIRQALAVPDIYSIEAAIAIGRAGDKALLPEALQAREVQSQRNPLSVIVSEGRFAF